MALTVLALFIYLFGEMGRLFNTILAAVASAVLTTVKSSKLGMITEPFEKFQYISSSNAQLYAVCQPLLQRLFCL